QPTRHAGRVHGCVAAAVDGDATTDDRPSAGSDVAQEAHGVDAAAGVGGGDLDPLGQVRPDGHEDRVEAALARRAHQGLDRGVVPEHHADVDEAADLGVEDGAGQPVLGDAVAHHPARQVR